MPIPDRLNPTFAAAAETTIDQALADSAVDPMDAARQHLIVALDVPGRDAALALVERLEGQCLWLKVGLELFVAAGPRIVEELAGSGHSIFLDLKFHDIPNTVAGAVRSAATLGAAMINVHAGGGPAMLRAARAALDGFANPPELLAVTMLTSMDQEQVSAVGLERTPAAQVELLARMSLEAGALRRFCVFSAGGCHAAGAGRPGGAAGGSGDSAGGKRYGRPEAHRHARGDDPLRSKPPGGGQANYPGRKAGGSRCSGARGRLRGLWLDGLRFPAGQAKSPALGRAFADS